MEKVTGQPVLWFRPPFGVTNPTLAKAVRRLGYIPIGWNIRTLDTQQPTPEKIIKRIKKRLVPGSILLLHDRMPDSDRLLVQVLDFIEKEGYTVVTLDRLIKDMTNHLHLSENHILPFSLQEFQQTFILHNDAFCQTDSDRENG